MTDDKERGHAYLAKIKAVPLDQRGLGWRIRAQVTRLMAHLPVYQTTFDELAAMADALEAENVRFRITLSHAREEIARVSDALSGEQNYSDTTPLIIVVQDIDQVLA